MKKDLKIEHLEKKISTILNGITPELQKEDNLSPGNLMFSFQMDQSRNSNTSFSGKHQVNYREDPQNHQLPAPKVSTPTLSELLGNIDAIASNNLASFGIKNTIGQLERAFTFTTTQNQLNKVFDIPAGPSCGYASDIKNQNSDQDFQDDEGKKHSSNSNYKDMAGNRSFTSKHSYTVTVSKVRGANMTGSEGEEDTSGVDIIGNLVQVEAYGSGSIMITPNKSPTGFCRLRCLSPICEKNMELTVNRQNNANNSMFLSPESKHTGLIVIS